MPPSDYELVTILKDGSCRSKITRRRRPHLRTQYSFKLYKVYEKEGEDRDTPWLDPRHLDSLARLMVKTRETIDREQEEEARELAR